MNPKVFCWCWMSTRSVVVLPFSLQTFYSLHQIQAWPPRRGARGSHERHGRAFSCSQCWRSHTTKNRSGPPSCNSSNTYDIGVLLTRPSTTRSASLSLISRLFLFLACPTPYSTIGENVNVHRVVSIMPCGRADGKLSSWSLSLHDVLMPRSLLVSEHQERLRICSCEGWHDDRFG